MENIVCKNCGFAGQPKRVVPGHFLIELILWLCYLVPGLIYTIWRRHVAAYDACPICGSKELVPANSPFGREIADKAQSAGGGTLPPSSFFQQAPYQKEKALGVNRKWLKAILLLVVVGLPLYAMMSMTTQIVQQADNGPRSANTLSTSAGGTLPMAACLPYLIISKQ